LDKVIKKGFQLIEHSSKLSIKNKNFKQYYTVLTDKQFLIFKSEEDWYIDKPKFVIPLINNNTLHLDLNNNKEEYFITSSKIGTFKFKMNNIWLDSIKKIANINI
jgi:hypothetical protein